MAKISSSWDLRPSSHRCPALPAGSVSWLSSFGTWNLSNINFANRISSLSPHATSSICCVMTKTTTDIPSNLEKEPHKYFDQVVIIARSGDGGHGAVFNMPKPTAKVQPKKNDKEATKKDKPQEKKVKKGPLKRGSDGSLILPMGGQGGDVILVADENIDSLLEFHRKKRYNAKRGSNVDAIGGSLTPFLHDGLSASPLRIPVPVGTVIKRKRGGKFLADLSRPGDEFLVARGGRGGISMVEIPKDNRSHLKPVNAPVMTDPNDKILTKGLPGEEVALELTLRVVADVGLVGLPNAGKSSLLAAVSLARPSIADYPFTTLMPNLGRIEQNLEDLRPTVADLPGLIKGAHLGKGLGRMFLRHLRRTRLLIHVVDISAPDPVNDYKVLREELHMYNPDYLRRPHIVALNKLDLPEAMDRVNGIKKEILEDTHIFSQTTVDDSDCAAALHIREEFIEDMPRTAKVNPTTLEDFPRPVAVVGISALQQVGIESLLTEIRTQLEKLEVEKDDLASSQAERETYYKSPQWRL